MAGAQQKIGRIEVRRLRLPLTKPYRLAFGVQHAFDTVLVTVEGEDGEGFGEATLVPGYTDETVEMSYSRAEAMAPTLAGLTIAEARRRLQPVKAEAAFTATAFLTALDVLERHPALLKPARVPLLAILSSDGTDPGAARAEIDKHIAAGYRTLKFKVGFDLERDLKAVAAIQKETGGRAAIRVDANQGFSTADGVAFVSRIDPASIELVEQCCDKADWDAAVAVKRAARVPVMLDESIYSERDVDRAAELRAADIIKLKLMKMGSLDDLSSALERIVARGMRPVCGNGVATDIGCWGEAVCMPGRVDNAGENNGFLKTPVQLMDPPLVMDGPTIVVPGTIPRLDRKAVEGVTVARQSFPSPRS